MIGVIANPSEGPVVREFFELFKTPWEFYRVDGHYDVLLCSGDASFDRQSAKLILIYAGEKLEFDAEEQIEVTNRKSTGMLFYRGVQLPIYQNSMTFAERGTAVLVDDKERPAAIHIHRAWNSVVKRIGYSLFSEIATLLTDGQPADCAAIPTLDLHIAFLRDMIVSAGIALAEVPPIPQGYGLMVCLTHDVDHPSIRVHKWDHTMFGFLYRAVFGSLSKLIRGRIHAKDLITNWLAAFKLPLVYMGFANDFWRGFEERYLELEAGLGSTFFVIPFKNYSGKVPCGMAPQKRASRYQARNIAHAVRKIVASGCEVGLHGIDAWLDSASAGEELEEIRRLTGAREIGVRMHWLYYGKRSPLALEQAGAAYDSTVGYRETVGYRAGTTQAYKPLEVERMLELPMQVMDTALFYPDYLDLSSEEASKLLGEMVDHTVQVGGCLTINWHDRSLAPERLWYACYHNLVHDLKNRNVWFATASEAISWFKKRRSVVFETDGVEPYAVRARVTAPCEASLPGLTLRIHELLKCESGAQKSTPCVDIAFDESVDVLLHCGASA
jgi:hypothetical protein